MRLFNSHIGFAGQREYLEGLEKGMNSEKRVQDAFTQAGVPYVPTPHHSSADHAGVDAYLGSNGDVTLQIKSSGGDYKINGDHVQVNGQQDNLPATVRSIKSIFGL